MTMRPHSINREQRLYVLKSGSGFTCLGFDVVHKRTLAMAQWLQRRDLEPPARRGTLKAWNAYNAALSACKARYDATRERCPVELEKRLIGLEGRRVEVTAPGEAPRRFYVGKSTGWLPIHLEIANSRSTGGGACYLPENARVTVIR